jgi:hypothetical protein
MEREEREVLAVAAQFIPCGVRQEEVESFLVGGLVDRFGEGVMVPAMVVMVVGPSRQAAGQASVVLRGLLVFIIDDLAQEELADAYAIRNHSAMKTRYLKSLLLALIVLAGSQAALQAQSYSIDWFKIASGGGTSTNGQYSVSGTIGQPDAGTMSGGEYLVTGGFWSVIAAVQTPGAPVLRIIQTNGVVAVSWPNSAAGWELDASTTLAGEPPPWSQVSPSQYQTNSAEVFITLRSPTGNAFYRLRKL